MVALCFPLVRIVTQCRTELRGAITRTIEISWSVVLLTLLSACASPVEGLWPLPPESVQHTVSVSIDTWHAMIAFPRKKGKLICGCEGYSG